MRVARACTALLVAALALSTMLKDQGRLTVNGVELESAGGGLPVGGAVRLKVDYSVDVLVRPISVGVLCVEMRDEQPMRVRNRNVLLTYDPARTGLDRFRLDFSKSGMEIEDPGAWQVDGPASLFDVLGSRSGRGSMWLEVDLRFKVNLGPVSVSGATIRATRGDDGGVTASMRGLDASLDVPGVLNGRGAFQLEPAGGFGAELDVALVPLNLSAGATPVLPAAGRRILSAAGCGPARSDPARQQRRRPVSAVAGSFGYGVRPALPPPGHPDPVGFQLAWDSGSAGRVARRVAARLDLVTRRRDSRRRARPRHAPGPRLQPQRQGRALPHCAGLGDARRAVGTVAGTADAGDRPPERCRRGVVPARCGRGRQPRRCHHRARGTLRRAGPVGREGSVGGALPLRR